MMDALNPEGVSFYRAALDALVAARREFLVGGAFALERHTGILRYTKDFDIFVRPCDLDRTLDALSKAGYHAEVPFPHWLAKIFHREHFIDVIYGSGNGIVGIDDEWFEHAVQGEVIGLSVRLVPVEEMIWSKAFIMERERYDGADVAHLLRFCGERLDWPRLLTRFGPHWRVLLAHLVLFGFIYPGLRDIIPRWVLDELVGRLRAEMSGPIPTEKLCQGTLLSRQQYLSALDEGFIDARLMPRGRMTPEETAHWTAAIDEKK